ncbi:hypothetical protein D3C78_936310 [compost metagenome]
MFVPFGYGLFYLFQHFLEAGFIPQLIPNNNLPPEYVFRREWQHGNCHRDIRLTTVYLTKPRLKGSQQHYIESQLLPFTDVDHLTRQMTRNLQSVNSLFISSRFRILYR